MNCNLDLKPGTWANFNTNILITNNDTREDIVKNPVFVISREEYPCHKTFMCIDQRKSLLVWRLENQDPLNPKGTISGLFESKSFIARMNTVFLNCLPQEKDLAILPVAEERKRGFLLNYPDLKNCFFNSNINSIVDSIAKSKEVSVLCCPLTLEPFKDPVTAPDGRNYERAAIVEWLNKKGTSPFTSQPMQIDQLITNFALKSD
jgi:hypothetical protein